MRQMPGKTGAGPLLHPVDPVDKSKVGERWIPEHPHPCRLSGVRNPGADDWDSLCV